MLPHEGEETKVSTPYDGKIRTQPPRSQMKRVKSLDLFSVSVCKYFAERALNLKITNIN
jgi:hypothetical protein